MLKSIKTSVLALLLVGTAVYAQAQKKINQGTVVYGITYDLSPEQKAAVDVSVLPAESSINFNGDFSNLKMESGPALITIIGDHGTKSSLILIDVPIAQKQFATKMNEEDIKKQNGDINYTNFKATGEKQTLAGYNAEKYSYTDDKGGAYELWATQDVQLAPGAQFLGFSELKSTPLKLTMLQNGVKTTFTVKSIKEAKVGPYSLTVPAGYDLKTMDEMKAMQGGQ